MEAGSWSPRDYIVEDGFESKDVYGFILVNPLA